jgi:hypothetical protein
MASLLDGWLVGTGLWAVVAVFLPWSRNRAAQMLASGAGALFLVSLGCILVPLRPSLHYLQLAVVPWTLVLGGITGLATLAAEERKAAVRLGILCGALACSTAGVLGAWAVKPHLYVRSLRFAQLHPRSDTTRMLLSYAKPGEPLGVWGWQPSLFAEGGFRQATREAHTYAQIADGPYRGYFRQRYLADLERSRPPVFVDVVGPQAFWFQDPLLAHDASFPELAAYVRANYTQVGNPEGCRVYVRNDRVPGNRP